jgi:hypothetical protein
MRKLLHATILRDWMSFRFLSHGMVHSSALYTTYNHKAFPTVTPLTDLGTHQHHKLHSAKAHLAAAQCMWLSPWYSKQLVKQLFENLFKKKSPKFS